MLIYHPAFDNYHGMIRVLKILNNIPKNKYNYDRIRIYDYFLLFPNDLRKTTLPTAYNFVKNIRSENKYNKIQSSQDVFRRLEGFQYLSMNALSSYDLIDKQAFSERMILKTDIDYENPLLLTEVEKKYFEFLNTYANKISLKELKERTKLMEHRYELS